MWFGKKTPRNYLVQPGDTLYTICRRHAVDKNEVIALNEMINPDMIMAGSSLLLPREPYQSLTEGIENHFQGLRKAFGKLQDSMHHGWLQNNALMQSSTLAILEAQHDGEASPGKGRMIKRDKDISMPSGDDALVAMWNEINSNGDARLSRAELKQYANNKFLPESYINDFLFEADKDRSGCIDFIEFKNYVESKELALRKAFDGIDADGSGYISVHEMESAFRVLVVEGKAAGTSAEMMRDTRYRIPERAVKELIKRLDYDGNGKLDFNEFRSFFAMIPRSELEYLTPYWRKSAMDIGTGYLGSHMMGLKGEKAGAEGSPWAHLFSGGVAGAVAKTCTAPLETIRVRMMVGGKTNSGAIVTAQHIFREGGVGGFFRGNVVGSLSAMPSKGICFLSFEWIKNLIAKDRKLSNTELLVAGAAAGAITEVIIHPTSLISHRMMVEKSYKSIGDCVAKTIKKEGIKGLWASGLWPSVLGIVPFTVMSYGVYDILEKQLEEATGKPASLAAKTALGMFAGWAGMTAAAPLSVVRTRLMTQNLSGVASSNKIYHGVRDAFVRIYKEEGVAAFYKGLGIASIRMLPVGGISRGTYEAMQMAITALDDQLQRMKHLSELRALTRAS